MTEAIWLALHGEGPKVLRSEITARYGYEVERGLETITGIAPVRRHMPG